jgi:hypothetical protein
VLVVADGQAAGLGIEAQHQLAVVERLAVVNAQHGQQHLAGSSTLSGCQSMSKCCAKSEAGPFSSTSIHQALSAPNTPMWLGTMSSSWPRPCAFSAAHEARKALLAAQLGVDLACATTS